MSDGQELAMLYREHVAAVMARTESALAATGFDHLVVFAGSERLRLYDDAPYPFAVNPQFKAWLPLTSQPDCFLVFTPGSTPRLAYYQPDDYWYAPPESPAGYWPAQFDITVIKESVEALAMLPDSGRVAILGEFANEALRPGRGEVNPRGLLAHLDYQRAWKTRYEIECMRRANATATRAHQAAEAAFRAGGSEYEIHLAYCAAAGHTENELPYSSIVALNQHGAVLHYQNWQRTRPAPGELHSFLIDAGASCYGYAADITRTYSAADADFQALIDAMDAAQQRLCAMLRPGIDYRDVHLQAHREVATILSECGLVKRAADEVYAQGITRMFFPHGVGHYIGLQVHDVGGFMGGPDGSIVPKPEGHPFLRLTRILDPGHVMTIEPGLYFIDSLLRELRASAHADAVDWKMVDSLRKFGGIRIEDDVAVTETGYENLTRDQFRLLQQH